MPKQSTKTASTSTNAKNEEKNEKSAKRKDGNYKNKQSIHAQIDWTA